MNKTFTIEGYEDFADLYHITDGTNTATIDGSAALVIFGDLVEFDAEDPRDMVGKTFTLTQ